MTQPLAVAAETCDEFLRQGRESLAQGKLASASAAGWRAAVLALEDYSGSPVADGDFRNAARGLVKDTRAHTNTAEWVVSAIALSDNVDDDWLDADGIARRLDDVQRLALLVKDIAKPPQSPDDVLGHAWACMDNGALAPASEKGWEAALWATKTYADAMGHGYRGDNHFDLVMRILSKDDVWHKEAAECESGALALRSNGAYCTVYPHWLHDRIVSDDIEAVAKLVSLIQQLAFTLNRPGGESV